MGRRPQRPRWDEASEEVGDSTILSAGGIEPNLTRLELDDVNGSVRDSLEALTLEQGSLRLRGTKRTVEVLDKESKVAEEGA
jgi:hypothetical protein